MRAPSPAVRPSLHRAAASLGFLLVLPALLSAAGCGEPEVGGSGTRRGARHLVVEGSPYQMGWWQGRLLGDRVRALHARWQDAAFREAAGDASRAGSLREACRVYVAHTLPLLPEAARQELDGLAAACGLPAEDLLLTEVLRDGLRYAASGARLLGGALGAGGPEAPEALAWAPEGPDAELLAGEWILLERRPEGGTATIVVTWPGSLGGVLGAGARGVALAAREEDAPLERQSMRGVPFPIALRLALERAGDARAALAALSRTTAHLAVALDPRAASALAARVDAAALALDVPVPPAPAGAPLRAAWRAGAFEVEAYGERARLPGP